MIKLNDYLYGGHTIFRILKQYREDLYADAMKTGNEIDLLHCEFLDQISDLLEHNEFLTAQSQKIREFYKYMAQEYPFLAFTFKGRIKSLIRAEAKFNGYIVEYMDDYYQTHGTFPEIEEMKPKLTTFRDLIAYRIVISMPKCHLRNDQYRDEVEKQFLYQIANVLPNFMKARGFIPEPTGGVKASHSDLLDEQVKPYYRDYINDGSQFGYESLHITFYDESAKCYTEMQLRTKKMDDFAEIGPANHWGYEKRQETERSKREHIPQGVNRYYDEAHERGLLLQNIELSELDVNMFGAVNNSLINDGCGLYRGRLILPYEHLSHFQNDEID